MTKYNITSDKAVMDTVDISKVEINFGLPNGVFCFLKESMDLSLLQENHTLPVDRATQAKEVVDE